MSIRVAIIGSRGYPYVYSGYETFVREIAERLARAGLEVTVYNHRNLFKDRPRFLNGIRLVYLWTIEKKNFSQFIHSFQSALHASLSRNDIILAVNPANGPFGAFFRLFRKRSAINTDGVEWRRPKWKGLGSRYFYWASKTATRLYDVIVSDCVAMHDIYKKEFGVDSAVIAYGAYARDSKNPGLIAKWGLRSRDYYLIVGRLIPDNNAELIAREFRKTGSRRKLVIVGDVPYRDSYAQRLKAVDDPRLQFTGYIHDQEELAELYHHCFAYFHGHEFGGTNPTLLTALGYGCAVCALDTVFSREVLQDGEYGLFFTKKDDNLRGIIDGMEMGTEQVEGLRAKSRRRIVENYTWDQIAGQYQALFQRMIGG
jgi:glycosyltransferase involved in cell wall biosynthesis